MLSRIGCCQGSGRVLALIGHNCNRINGFTFPLLRRGIFRLRGDRSNLRGVGRRNPLLNQDAGAFWFVAVAVCFPNIHVGHDSFRVRPFV